MRPKWIGMFLLMAILLGTTGCTVEQEAVYGKEGSHQAGGQWRLAQPVVVERALVIGEQSLPNAQCYELSVAGDEHPGLSCASEDFILYTGEWSRPMAQKLSLIHI